MVSQEFEYAMCMAILTTLGTTIANNGHDFGKCPLQNGANRFKQFIRKSVHFFNIK